MAGGFECLSGLWNGQFTYPRNFEPEFFTAVLLETSGRLGGSTQEVARVGRSRGLTLYATIRGDRHGAKVSFRKTYESETRTHSVFYEGTVNADGTEIEGRWSVRENWSGRFLMLRDAGQSQAITRRISEKLPG